jgi:hypothetical protein
VATIIYYAPQAIRVRISCFALPSEVSLNQADHVSSEESACSTRAGGATPVSSTDQAYVPVVTRSASGLYLLFLIFPVRRSEVMPVLEA